MTAVLRWRQGRYLIYQDPSEPLPWLLVWPGRSMAFRTSGDLIRVLGEVLTDPRARDPYLYRQSVQRNEKPGSPSAARHPR